MQCWSCRIKLRINLWCIWKISETLHKSRCINSIVSALVRVKYFICENFFQVIHSQSLAASLISDSAWLTILFGLVCVLHIAFFWACLSCGILARTVPFLQGQAFSVSPHQWWSRIKDMPQHAENSNFRVKKKETHSVWFGDFGQKWKTD